MPTYLYECPAHGEFEHQHSINDELEFCPLCEEEGKEDLSEPHKVKRLIAGGTQFVLNGSGWAKDNYK
jgi:putative FmdB family regulatory protein